MVEAIGEFGLEELALVGEEVRARDGHAGWVGELVGAAAEGLKGHAQLGWLDRLEAEQANIRAALGWLAERGQIEQGLETAASLWLFWLLRGHFGEARGQLEDLL